MKKCSSCQKEKNLSEFNKCKTNKDGLHYVCKSCRKIEREKNKEHIKIKQKEYYSLNREELQKKNKEYRTTNIEKINVQKKQYKEQNKDHIRQKNKEYLPIRKEKIKERRKIDKNFQIKEVLRSKIHKMLKGKKSSFIEYLEIDIEMFKKWISFQFLPDMNWDNFGILWQLDHIIPINQFNLENKNEQKICFNWTNLQPLYCEENRKKSDKLELHYYFNSIISTHRFINLNSLDKKCYQKICESLSWLRHKLRYGKKAPDITMGNQQPSP